MEKFKTILLAEAKEMSEGELQMEIGKRSKYLKEQLGMDVIEAANFTISLLNMGAAMNAIFESKKNKEK